MLRKTTFDVFHDVGLEVKQLIFEAGGALLFFFKTIRTLFRGGVEPYQVIRQIYAVGVQSVSATVVTGMFVGAIMAMQINLQLRDFGAQAYLGGLTSSVTIRNVGPVLIAFILSGKVGAYTSAELATMQVTDQISAIRCLGTDPIRYLVLPRLLAVVISSAMLLMVGIMMTIGGGMLMASFQLGVNSLNYIQNIPGLVSWGSISIGIIKSLVFGLLIGIIACYRGFHASRGSAGVGIAVKSTSVATAVCIIAVDYLVSWWVSKLYFLMGWEII